MANMRWGRRDARSLIAAGRYHLPRELRRKMLGENDLQMVIRYLERYTQTCCEWKSDGTRPSTTGLSAMANEWLFRIAAIPSLQPAEPPNPCQISSRFSGVAGV
jgi:hypothetical protein